MIAWGSDFHIGRTGRAGKAGQAITLVSTEEFRELMRIQKEVGADMRLETISGEGGVDEGTIDFVLQALEETAIHPEIDRVIEALAHLDQATFIKKALSYMLEQVQVGMGDQICYDQHHVDDLIRSYHDEQRAESSTKKKRKRRR
jgi:ATP-dependent RNA helicase DeaD